jgi:hypothetical protein
MDHQHPHHRKRAGGVDPADPPSLLLLWLCQIVHWVRHFTRKGRPYGRPLSSNYRSGRLLCGGIGWNGRIGRHRRIGGHATILGRRHVTSGHSQHERQSQNGKKLSHIWSPFHSQIRMAGGKNSSHWQRPSDGPPESGIVFTPPTLGINDDKNVIDENHDWIQWISLKRPWCVYA